jgi:hypothetical protein
MYHKDLRGRSSMGLCVEHVFVVVVLDVALGVVVDVLVLLLL